MSKDKRIQELEEENKALKKTVAAYQSLHGDMGVRTVKPTYAELREHLAKARGLLYSTWFALRDAPGQEELHAFLAESGDPP